MFECNFKCTMTGMIPNSRIRCEMGVWSEIYFNHFHHLCMASEAKRPKIQPRRPLFTTAQPKTINEKAKTSLVIPKPTKKSSTGVIWIETLIVHADQLFGPSIPAHRNTKQNTRNAKLKKPQLYIILPTSEFSSYFGSFACTKYICENTWTSYCLFFHLNRG